MWASELDKADQLLSRQDFAVKVLARSKGKCAFCDNAAVDAHHIFDRKLYFDGGYFLSNGAAVCEKHHWQCETTCLSVVDVLRQCSIEQAKLPPGLDPQMQYDKWGNRLRSDGLREPGPLFLTTGCHKALAIGGYLGLFVPVGTPEGRV